MYTQLQSPAYTCIFIIHGYSYHTLQIWLNYHLNWRQKYIEVLPFRKKSGLHVLHISFVCPSKHSLHASWHGSQVWLWVFPYSPLGQDSTHPVPLRKVGAEQLVHVSAVPSQVRHASLHISHSELALAKKLIAIEKKSAIWIKLCMQIYTLKRRARDSCSAKAWVIMLHYCRALRDFW